MDSSGRIAFASRFGIRFDGTDRPAVDLRFPHLETSSPAPQKRFPPHPRISVAAWDIEQEMEASMQESGASSRTGGPIFVLRF